MHSDIFSLFDEICRNQGAGGDVLEIGARPAEDTLLCLPSIAESRSRIGIDLDGPYRYAGFSIVKGNANDLSMFSDASFDTVLCNAVLEHDAKFWLTLAEIRRVLRPGGLFVVGVPGYTPNTLTEAAGDAFDPALAPAWFKDSTPVLVVHDYPADFYRFSPASVAAVLMEGMVDIDVFAALQPPRLVASGRRLPAEAHSSQRSDKPTGLAQLDRLAAALAPLGPPTVVFNKSHSGSRVLGRALRACGVFMGAHCNESEDSLDLLRLVDYLMEFHFPDFSRLFADGDPVLSHLVRDVFDSHLTGFDGRGHWGWKLCETHFVLPVIARLFPTATFVHLLRDGRDVAFSDFTAPTTPIRKKACFGTDTVESWRGMALTETAYRAAPHRFNAQLWVSAVTNARAHGAMLGERYREIRYEDLVEDFIGTVGRLASALALSGDPAALQGLADDVHAIAVGKHRRAAPQALAEVLDILGPALAAFGYGLGERPGETTLAVVVLDLGGDGDAGLGAMLGEVELLNDAADDIIIVSDRGDRIATSRARIISVPVGTAEGIAAGEAAPLARGTYVVFARTGQRFNVVGLQSLLRETASSHGVAGIGRLGRAASPDELSVQIVNQDILRWAEAVPVGAALFLRTALVAATIDATVDLGAWWYWSLVKRTADSGLIHFADIIVGTVPDLPIASAVPIPVLDYAARPPLSPDAAKRVFIYGSGGASTDLLFDGLPAELRRHLFAAAQIELGTDIQRLLFASVVLIVRDFQLPMQSGVIDALIKMGIPFYYVVDDHFPTLGREYEGLSFYTEQHVADFLARSAGAIVATPALQAALAPLGSPIDLWPPIFDPDLVPDERSGAGDEWLRFGIMGGTFRAAPLQRSVMPALADLACRRPIEIVVRDGIAVDNCGLASIVTLPFEPSFRRFVFAWRRQNIDALIHPPALTANAGFKNANALLVSRYLGAVPILAAEDPAYRDLPPESGAVLVGEGHRSWAEALELAADPAFRRSQMECLDAWCRATFTHAAGARILARILDGATEVTNALVAQRIARLNAGMPLVDLSLAPTPRR